MPACQHCHTSVARPYTLCQACESLLFRTLLQLAKDLEPLRDSLDATLHPGGHQPTRTITPTAPTPLRLDVLDLLDTIDATGSELLRRLNGVDAQQWNRVATDVDTHTTLWCIAGHPRLATYPDAGLTLDTFARLSAQTDRIIDPPEHRREIGPCDTCATMLTAGPHDQWVTCPACERVQRVQTVRLRRLERLCFDDTRRGSAAEIARAFTDAGITVRRGTINIWKNRGIIPTDTHGNIAYCDVYRRVIAPTSLTNRRL
ncbi:hypothetical protein [Bifidobacterium samirii]|uniref:PhnA protein n=1 Tax=Bifidobacterium samirii TaxID=2306974 RepID=A0A430FJQ5_9BIFI|nr:hypothetical protein [Bifidobacterium samirii]RSX53012.1 hypothetical protein D2E24_1683 [Bifidobacterium samirii]